MNNIKLLREEDENELVQIPKNKRRKHSTRKKICREKMHVGTFRSVIFRRYTDTQNRRERARERKRETQTIQYNCTSLLFCDRCSLCVSSYNANNDVSAHSYETDFSSSSTNNANTNSNRELCVRACVCACLTACLHVRVMCIYMYAVYFTTDETMCFTMTMSLLACLPACLFAQILSLFSLTFLDTNEEATNMYTDRHIHVHVNTAIEQKTLQQKQ